MHSSFPNHRHDILYLTEGGSETEIMYKFGYELPHFAMFPLLDNPKAVAAMKGMFQRYLDTVGWFGLPSEPGLGRPSGLFPRGFGGDATPVD